ncbi:MAG: LysR family transcriptional regulator [Clostridia bacterium]|nr:LysR family transcriptional regulator [Clostridia bacterium]
MDIRNVKTFVRVAELKSFTKAAEKLNYVQSTVTAQIKQLEKELGYSLFDRIGKRISLTVMGESFLKIAYELLKVAEKAENLNASSNDIKAVLRVGVSESLLISVFKDLIPEFKAMFKNIDLRIRSGHTVELLEQLRQNNLDLLFVAKARNTDPDLKCYYARKEESVFVSSPDYKSYDGKSVTTENIFKQNFIVTEREGMYYTYLSKLAAESNASVNDWIEVDNVLVIIELVKKGLGVAFLPEYLLSNEIESGNLKKLEVTALPDTYYSQILCHKDRWVTPFMKELINMLRSKRPERD